MEYNNNKNASCDEYHPCFILGLIRQMACKVIVTDVYTIRAQQVRETKEEKSTVRICLVAAIDFFHRARMCTSRNNTRWEREGGRKKGKKEYVNEETKQQNGLLNLHKIDHNYISSFQQTTSLNVARVNTTIPRETRFPSIGYSRWQRIVDLSQWKSQLCSQEFGTSI